MNTTHYMIELAPESNSTYARDAAEECNRRLGNAGNSDSLRAAENELGSVHVYLRTELVITAYEVDEEGDYVTGSKRIV